jgi:opacity protein-like surface antigen
MKKFAAAALLATVALAASAVEVGVTAVDATATNPDRYGYGVTVGENFGAYNLTAGASRFYREADAQNRYTLVASRDVVTLGPVAVSGRVGYAYLDNKIAQNGNALTLGVGAQVPVTKAVAATLSIDHQYGQERVEQFNGNIVTAGLKYSF